MNSSITENETKVLNILNYPNDSNDIWTPVQKLIDKSKMDLGELEVALYFLQVRRLVRISSDGDVIKITTEEKVNSKLSNRINSALGGMLEAEQEAVEDENYEDASKYRDYSKLARDPSKHDELIERLLGDIDSEDEK